MRLKLLTPIEVLVDETVARINADLGKVLRAPDLQERLFALGAEPMPSSTADFTAFLKQEHGRWSKVLKELDIRPTQ